MDTLSRSDLMAMLAPQRPPCLSIYLPMHGEGREREQDPLRLAQLIDQAQAELEKFGQSSVEARDFLAPLRALSVDTDLWNQRSDGLAIFCSPDKLQYYHLPLSFDSRVAVGSRFMIRPLLPLISQDDRFLLLTLSQKHVRLYEGNRFELFLREVPGLPQGMEKELCLTATEHGAKQMPTSSVDRERRHGSTYYGHGGAPDSPKDRLRRFFKNVDKVLQPILHKERLPLILAGVDYELPIYRKVNTYPHLAARQLEANCDYFSDYQLHHEYVWPIVEELLAEERRAATDRLYNSAPLARRRTDIENILPAASAGRVGTLWIEEASDCRGTFEPERGEVTLSPSGASEGEDLLDRAAFDTLLHDGTVFALPRNEMPDGETVAAVLRY
jgi:hypothetical protein